MKRGVADKSKTKRKGGSNAFLLVAEQTLWACLSTLVQYIWKGRILITFLAFNGLFVPFLGTFRATNRPSNRRHYVSLKTCIAQWTEMENSIQKYKVKWAKFPKKWPITARKCQISSIAHQHLTEVINYVFLSVAHKMVSFQRI